LIKPYFFPLKTQEISKGSELFECFRDFLNQIQKDSSKIIHPLQNSIEQPSNMKMRPKIMVKNQNSHHGNEHILQKVGKFHKKHENKISGFKEGNEEDFKEVTIEKEIDSEQRILLEQALKRQEQDESEGIDTKLLSKKKKII